MSGSNRQKLTNPEGRLPSLRLMGFGGVPAPLQTGRRSSLVLALLHGGGCAKCASYLERLRAEIGEIAAWDGEVVAVVPESKHWPAGLGEAIAHLRIMMDPERQLASATAIDAPATLIVDQWGEIKDVRAAGPGHAFPQVSESVSWLRYLATQCPECEGESL